MKHRGVFKPISMARRSIDHANDHANVLGGVLEKIGWFFVRCHNPRIVTIIHDIHYAHRTNYSRGVRIHEWNVREKSWCLSLDIARYRIYEDERNGRWNCHRLTLEIWKRCCNTVRIRVVSSRLNFCNRTGLRYLF